MFHTLDKYLDDDAFILQLFLFQGYFSQFYFSHLWYNVYECAEELWPTSSLKNFSQCSLIGSPVG